MKIPGLMDSWKNLEDQLRCEICRSFLDAPMALKCGHVFCSCCIRKFLELNKSDYCPSCKGPASNTDLKPEPRLAAILNILRANSFRKKLRSRLSGQSPENPSRNAVFAKLDLLDALFARGGTPVGREMLPMYRGLREAQLRAMFGNENLKFEKNWSLEELIKYHKEFIFQLQAALDGFKMQIFKNPPTREGVQKYWASEMLKMYGNNAFTKQEPKMSELFSEAQQATAAALLNFQEIREEVLRKRKREES